MRNMNDIDVMTFQPFGAGPRNCIAFRFALMEVKMAICKLLQHFTLEPTETTQVSEIIWKGKFTNC